MVLAYPVQLLRGRALRLAPSSSWSPVARPTEYADDLLMPAFQGTEWHWQGASTHSNQISICIATIDLGATGVVTEGLQVPI
jgi:hypothetical protein